jgi:hypothetical protein
MYVVERYIPGLSRSLLERRLHQLELVAREMEAEGIPVRYLGSTIVEDDEACFCHFEAPSERTVAEVNRRAGFAFDRIVRAVVVNPAVRREVVGVPPRPGLPRRLGHPLPRRNQRPRRRPASRRWRKHFTSCVGQSLRLSSKEEGGHHGRATGR